jgi:hypothetical protein
VRVGQKGRTGYVWWQRGHTPRGLRDVGYQSAWIIGAVCPARDTGVALVMTRLDTAAMNLFLAELGQGKAPQRPGADKVNLTPTSPTRSSAADLLVGHDRSARAGASSPPPCVFSRSAGWTENCRRRCWLGRQVHRLDGLTDCQMVIRRKYQGKVPVCTVGLYRSERCSPRLYPCLR